MQHREPGRLSRPYDSFHVEEMILRDFLAADRTILANERTLLAYVRTSLALLVGGVSLIHFLDGPVADLGGVVLCVAGAATVLLGFVRYQQMRGRISALGDPPSDQDVRALLQSEKDQNV